MLIDFGSTHLLVSLLALVIVLIILWKQKKNFSYLFFFSVFWIYLIGVVSVVVFPIHVPDSDITSSVSLHMNLALFGFSTCDFLMLCLRNIYENILLTIPFGFGISLIVQIKPKNILWLAMAVGLVCELLQLVISLIAHSGFRIVDINDVIVNAVGVLLGYGIFRIFGWLYSYITDTFDIRHKYICAYIYGVGRQTQ